MKRTAPVVWLASTLALPAAELGPVRAASGSPVPSRTAADGAVNPVLSANGGAVVFLSQSPNLVTNLVTGAYQVYWRDLAGSNTALVSANTLGAGGNDHSLSPSISSNGSVVVFESAASDLVPNDANGARDIFLRDMIVLAHRRTELVSVNFAGTGPGTGESRNPLLSPDGRYVAFESTAPDLVAADSNGKRDVFVRDLATETTMLLSANMPGTDSANGSAQLLEISSDGRLVAFFSEASNLFPAVAHNRGEIYVRDLQLSVTYWATRGPANNNTATPASSPRRHRIALAPGGQYAVLQDINASSPPGSGAALAGAVYRVDLPASTNWLVDSSGWPMPGLHVDAQGTITYGGRDGIYRSAVGSNSVLLVPNEYRHTERAMTIGAFRVAHGSGRLLFSHDPAAASTPAQIYIYDEAARENRLVSLDESGGPINRSVRGFFDVDQSGFVVAYESAATDVVTNDLNAAPDVFVVNGRWNFSLYSGTNHLVSERHPDLPAATGAGFATAQRNGFSAAGDRLLFLSTDSTLAPDDTNRWHDLFAHDLRSNRVFGIHGPLVISNQVLVSQTNSVITPSSISADGRFVLFHRSLGDQNQNGARTNAYRIDLINGGTQALTPYAPAEAMSQDGRWAASSTPGASSSRLQIVIQDFGDPFVATAPTSYVASVRFDGSGPGNGSSWDPALSPDGRWVVFLSQATDMVTNASSANVLPQLFARDLWLRRTHLVSVNAAGTGASHGASNFVISANGRFVAFQALTNRAIYFHDLHTRGSNANRLVCTACVNPSISADGRVIAYEAVGHVYIADMETASSIQIAAGSAPQISQDGRWVVFVSLASNLVTNDANGASDVFLHDRWQGTTLLLSRNTAGTGSGNGPSSRPVISPDGSAVAFQSFAGDLVPGDYNHRRDVFVIGLIAADSDGDSMDDDWEQFHFLSLARSGADDFDGDGQSDHGEFLSGSDPRDPASLLKIAEIAVLPGALREIMVNWHAAPARTYRLETKPDLSMPAWNPVFGDVMTGSAIGAKRVLPAAPTMFYRVQLMP